MTDRLSTVDGTPLPDEVAEFVAAARALEIPAGDALLARIQQSRTEGGRMLLPTATPPTPALRSSESTVRWRWGMLAAGVAAIGAVALWQSVEGTGRIEKPGQVGSTVASASRQPNGPGSRDAAASPSTAGSPAASPSRELAGLLAPWPVIAQAQQPSAPPAAPFPPITQVDPSRLVVGRRSYVRLSGNAYHDLVPHHTYDVTLDSARVGGRRLWRVVVEQPLMRSLKAPAAIGKLMDTLWLDGMTLRPRQRHYQAGVLNVRQTFSDTAFSEAVSIDTSRLGPQPRSGRVPFRFGTTKRLAASHLFVPTEAALRVLLRALPLGSGWRGSIGVLSGDSRMFAIGQPTLVNLRVAGVDTVQTFSGRFACWRVLLETGAAPEVWHVSQETGETILTDGAYDSTYPRSRSYLVSGFEETRKVPAVRLPR